MLCQYFFSIFVHIRLSLYLYLLVARFILFCLSSNKYIFSFATIHRAGGLCWYRAKHEVCMCIFWPCIFTDMVQQNVSVNFKNSFRHNESVESKSFFSNGDLNSISNKIHEHGIIHRHLFDAKTYILLLLPKFKICLSFLRLVRLEANETNHNQKWVT